MIYFSNNFDRVLPYFLLKQRPKELFFIFIFAGIFYVFPSIPISYLAFKNIIFIIRTVKNNK